MPMYFWVFASFPCKLFPINWAWVAINYCFNASWFKCWYCVVYLEEPTFYAIS